MFILRHAGNTAPSLQNASTSSLFCSWFTPRTQDSEALVSSHCSVGVVVEGLRASCRGNSPNRCPGQLVCMLLCCLLCKRLRVLGGVRCLFLASRPADVGHAGDHLSSALLGPVFLQMCWGAVAIRSLGSMCTPIFGSDMLAWAFSQGGGLLAGVQTLLFCLLFPLGASRGGVPTLQARCVPILPPMLFSCSYCKLHP